MESEMFEYRQEIFFFPAVLEIELRASCILEPYTKLHRSLK